MKPICWNNRIPKIPTFVHQKSAFCFVFVLFFFFGIFRIFLIIFLNAQPAAPSSHVERGWPHCIEKLKSYHVIIAEGLLSRGTSHQPRSSDHTGCQRVVHVRLYQALKLLLDLYVHSAWNRCLLALLSSSRPISRF